MWRERREWLCKLPTHTHTHDTRQHSFVHTKENIILFMISGCKGKWQIICLQLFWTVNMWYYRQRQQTCRAYISFHLSTIALVTTFDRKICFFYYLWITNSIPFCIYETESFGNKCESTVDRRTWPNKNGNDSIGIKCNAKENSDSEHIAIGWTNVAHEIRTHKVSILKYV